MEELVKLMDKYWDEHEGVLDEYSGKMFFEGDEEEGSDYNKIQDLLWSYLFVGSHWNYETRSFLQRHGYKCWIGDGDSFGILVACITKKGKTMTVC